MSQIKLTRTRPLWLTPNSRTIERAIARAKRFSNNPPMWAIGRWMRHRDLQGSERTSHQQKEPRNVH